MQTILGSLPESEKSVLFNEGVYIGDVLNFINEDELEIFNRFCKDLQNYVTREKKYFRYRYNYKLAVGEELVKTISVADIDNVTKFVTENNRTVHQKYFEFNIDSSPPTHDDINVVVEVFRRIISFFYPDIWVAYPTQPTFMLYEDGDFICEHRDNGESTPNRVCVLILYLSPEHEHNDGGGELITITNSARKVTTKPVFSTFSLMDFTKSNVEHAVEPVKNGFKRLSAIHFFNKV
jgi:Rps23 Pro-64 3,4-dihydroxylase Tpa1-like proline 4-hydroxylase